MSQYPIGMRQYGSSPVINQIVEFLGQNFDYHGIIDSFYDMCWNIDTAQGVWLDAWGRKVGVSRVVQVPSGDDFGFYGTGNQPFNQAPFFSGDNATLNYAIQDIPYRLLILAKAFLNITDCAIPNINKFLQILFPNRGKFYVVNTLNMTMQYQCYFSLAAWELAILINGFILPRPSGVKATLQIFIPGNASFGFYGTGSQPFNQAPFSSEIIYNVA